MKNITYLKQVYQKKIAKKFCNVDDISKCPNNGKCSCRIAAEIKAYIQSVIPDPYYKLSIDDFTGRDSNQQLLSNDIAYKAKENIIKYCWGNNMTLEKFKDISHDKRDNISVMDIRRKRCDNVVIFADSEVYGKPSSKKTGKTFIASLIMQEAIKRRAFPGNHIQTYDWVPFSSLTNYIISGDIEVISSKSCDWLVVDDIVGFKNTTSSDAFIASKVDPFFFERLRDNLPTIFVFRFDINKPVVSLESKFGVAIGKIANDKNTMIISLCEEIE